MYLLPRFIPKGLCKQRAGSMHFPIAQGGPAAPMGFKLDSRASQWLSSKQESKQQHAIKTQLIRLGASLASSSIKKLCSSEGSMCECLYWGVGGNLATLSPKTPKLTTCWLAEAGSKACSPGSKQSSFYQPRGMGWVGSGNSPYFLLQ